MGYCKSLSPFPSPFVNVKKGAETDKLASLLDRGTEDTNIYAITISYTTLLRRLGMEEVPILPSQQSWDI